MSGNNSLAVLEAHIEKHIQLLEELLRFRHFKRYYFQLSYDWERLDEIITRTNRLHPALLQNLDEYLAFLESLRE